MIGKSSATDALHARLKAEKDFGQLGPLGSFNRNGIVAQNVLREDLGDYSDEPVEYGTDASLICRLAAHARQDAAHALLNTKTIMDDQRRIKRRLWVVIGLLVLILVAVERVRL